MGQGREEKVVPASGWEGRGRATHECGQMGERKQEVRDLRQGFYSPR
jgi:hypothetical protein